MRTQANTELASDTAVDDSPGPMALITLVNTKTINGRAKEQKFISMVMSTWGIGMTIKSMDMEPILGLIKIST